MDLKNNEPNQRKRHELVITGRNELDLTGVLNVDSFDTEEFLLQTSEGYLGIRGEELNIKHLDLEEGRLNITGKIVELSYLDRSNTGENGSFWSKLFR